MIRIGIICPSEIAFRRFLPALCNLPNFQFVGVAIANYDEWEGSNDDVIKKERAKAEIITKEYGGKLFISYTSILESTEIDAIYLPLPPALHYKWAKHALLAGKHVLIEKPATIRLRDTKDLVAIAKKSKLAIHENYMFAFHNQLTSINEIMLNGEIGEVRLFKILFGFPRRDAADFRYNKQLGGGALMDCGGYTLKYASMLLGETTKITAANSNYINDFEVDIFGSATLVNKYGTTVQVAFGMDNFYKCDLEAWGSLGVLSSGRVLTAPAGFIPEATLKIANQTEIRKLPSDDAFMKSIQKFNLCIENPEIRERNYIDILYQADLINQFVLKAKI